MKLLILGATGAVGNAVLEEAASRGHAITACARNTERLTGIGGTITVEQLDVLHDAQKLARLSAECDTIVQALRPPPGDEQALVALTRAVLKAAEMAQKPVIITGGAATLKIGDGTEHTVLSAPGFLPDAIRPIAEACAAQDALLDDLPNADWTYLRPPAMLLDEDRTGRYTLGRGTLVQDVTGQSRISYADFAVAMIDLAELRPAPRQRLTVGW